MSSKTINQVKEGFFEISEADYQEQLAEGIEEEFILNPGRYKFFRGRHPNFKPGDLEPKNTTVTITLPLALDVFDYFEKRADELKVDSYQTLINNTLRAAMESETASQPSVRAALLADEKFIKAVAARVKALGSNGRSRNRAAKSKAKAKPKAKTRTTAKPKAKAA